jgi:hypothetical protein
MAYVEITPVLEDANGVKERMMSIRYELPDKEYGSIGDGRFYTVPINFQPDYSDPAAMFLRLTFEVITIHTKGRIKPQRDWSE